MRLITLLQMTGMWVAGSLGGWEKVNPKKEEDLGPGFLIFFLINKYIAQGWDQEKGIFTRFLWGWCSGEAALRGLSKLWCHGYGPALEDLRCCSVAPVSWARASALGRSQSLPSGANWINWERGRALVTCALTSPRSLWALVTGSQTSKVPVPSSSYPACQETQLRSWYGEGGGGGRPASRSSWHLSFPHCRQPRKDELGYPAATAPNLSHRGDSSPLNLAKGEERQVRVSRVKAEGGSRNKRQWTSGRVSGWGGGCTRGGILSQK